MKGVGWLLESTATAGRPTAFSRLSVSAEGLLIALRTAQSTHHAYSRWPSVSAKCCAWRLRFVNPGERLFLGLTKMSDFELGFPMK